MVIKTDFIHFDTYLPIFSPFFFFNFFLHNICLVYFCLRKSVCITDGGSDQVRKSESIGVQFLIKIIQKEIMRLNTHYNIIAEPCVDLKLGITFRLEIKIM